MQRRFLKHGFADIGIKAGLNQRLSYDQAISFSLNTFVDLGLAFTKDKYTLDPEKLCPVFKCYETEKYALKTNIASLFSVELFPRYKSFHLMPNLAFEHKIASSPFSVNLDITAVYSWYAYSMEESGQLTSYNYRSAKLSIEGRWYSTLKRNIRMGKSGNGLSGNYIAAGVSYLWRKDSRFLNNPLLKEPGIYAATGWQKTISKHLYYDIQLGMQYWFTPLLYQREWSPKVDIAVGYRF